METWTRDDGRWYAYEIGSDLFGLVVIIYFGGLKSARTRTVPVADADDAIKAIGSLARRRVQHGYRKATGI